MIVHSETERSLTDSQNRPRSALLATVPLTFLLTLYLLGTGRWGSYLGIPGLPFYVSDLVVALATVQVALAINMNQTEFKRLKDAPLILLLTGSLLVYAAARAVAGAHLSTDALRDLAPYGYAVVALLTYMLPLTDERRWRRAVYAVLVFHAIWVVALPRLPGFPWTLPTWGTDATILVARPDFDTCVLGIGAALALHDLLHGKDSATRTKILLGLFCGASIFGILASATRAGSLAGLLAVLVVVVAWLIGDGRNSFRLRTAARPGTWAAIGLLMVALAASLAFTPTGNRLVRGTTSASSEAYGTVEVRKTVWDQVASYVFRDVSRTAVGVGFGPNFIEDSGSRAALEGSTYRNVRSPHNYVLGTMARMGVAGAVLVALIIVLGWWLGFSTLIHAREPATELAAVVVIVVPVIAFFGVVLESPFGAVTYFWAIGQLSRPSGAMP